MDRTLPVRVLYALARMPDGADAFALAIELDERPADVRAALAVLAERGLAERARLVGSWHATGGTER
ncbi:hypothetical protein [Asanoa iriomotensis]|uniref:MarR family protein n=1 Tax=Asanoa iriomotensis TaxID=234613 RepID=A0ABQ4CAP9_9ACTN|nr:hypothetical protein [Asanoa iriomotensis]GIF59835.1 hypothetical protein Air01nite_59300 [Asanoa iriomotensis]